MLYTLSGYFHKFWSTGHHRISNAGKCLDITGNRLAWIDQCLKFFHYIFAVKYVN